MNSTDAILVDDDASGFTKTFPDIPCVSQILGGPSLRLGVRKNVSISLQVLDEVGMTLVDW